MDAPVPLIALALLAAAALVLEHPRAKAWAVLGALALTPVLLLAHIWDTDQLTSLRDRPLLLGAGVAAGLAGLALMTVLLARRPAALPLLAVASLPFRIPVAVGGAAANLLVPLYVVVAAAALAYAAERLRPVRGLDDERRARPDPPTRALEWALALVLVLYAVQASYSADFGKALENVVFFYVPFALLFVFLRATAWSPRLLRTCAGVLVVLALALAGVGFVEYATRHLFLNPKVIASNQLSTTFRVNSLFFDPNIYGRFLAIVMLLVAAWLIWTRRPRDVAVAAVVLAVLWGGLLLTLSQSSFTALLVGLAVLAGLRWSARRAVMIALAMAVAGVALVLAAPGALNLDLGSARGADRATSGRWDLLKGGVDLFTERPVAGHGSGGFSVEYRRSQHASRDKATSASHTIPVTIAAEQGVIGLGAYVALLWFALRRLLRDARGDPYRAAVAACFVALLAHTMLYAAFLEDPLTWALLGVGTALALRPRRRRARDAAPEPAPLSASP
ncbi:MAG TPA: O-antigen ligase family protein [Solirubrobacteraceae bacterium]|nr:O-antigen ligase family protein [Solirubrobacteraceae bacterium]